MNIKIKQTSNTKKTHHNKRIFSWQSFKTLLAGRSPVQLVLQYTDKCNAICPQCGMRATNTFKRKTLENDVVYNIIDHAVEQKVSAISFTGGEPFLFFDDLIAYITYASEKGIEYIRTGTNGFMFMNSDNAGYLDKIKSIAERMAATGLYTFWISLDSADAVLHEKMRGLKNVAKGIEKALPVFHDYGIYPAANLGINRNTGGYNKRLYEMAKYPESFNEHEFYDIFVDAFMRFYEYVIGLGFTITNACYPMSLAPTTQENLEAVYTATSEDLVVNFTKEEKKVLFQALFDTIPLYRSRIRIFTPRSSLFSLIKETGGDYQKSYTCKGGIDYFFIDSKNGHAYPCGYRGSDDMGRFTDLNIKSIVNKPYCKECDWECFRDPSTVLGPVMHPLSLLKKIITDKEFMKIWRQDLSYYRACDYFNGRIPLDVKKMQKYTC